MGSVAGQIRNGVRFIFDTAGRIVGYRNPLRDDDEAFNAPVLEPLAADYASAGNPKFARPYTWATLPAPADYIGPAYVSDIGLHGSMWRSDGSTWGLVDGHCVLEASAVAKAAVTGSTTETLVHTYAMPAGLLGLNGELELQIRWSHTNSANTKTYRVRLGGLTGTLMNSAQGTTSTGLPNVVRIANRGSASVQIGGNGTLGFTAGSNSPSWQAGAVDTSAAVDVAITAQLANASDSSTMESLRIVLVRP